MYGLGATLFAALTGHAAFERRSGEQVVAQFLRIASESAPDLREQRRLRRRRRHRRNGDGARSRMTGRRLSNCARRSSASRPVHGLPVDEMALRSERHADQPARQASDAGGTGRTLGNIPLELTSFVGRHRELSEVQNALSAARLVTLTGIGGVGKTRLALRIAGEVRTDFPRRCVVRRVG